MVLRQVLRKLTFEVTGRRSAKRGGNSQAQLAGGPVDREVSPQGCHLEEGCFQEYCPMLLAPEVLCIVLSRVEYLYL
jgi:hypothetical protein